MNQDNIKLAVYTTASAVVVIAAAKSCIRVHREEQQKRLEIERNKQLDIEAIKRVSPVMEARIEAGEIRDLPSLIDSFHNEIAFQKIAIREDH